MKTRVYISYPFDLNPSFYAVMGGWVESFTEIEGCLKITCDNNMVFSLPSEAIYINALSAWEEAVFSNENKVLPS